MTVTVAVAVIVTRAGRQMWDDSGRTRVGAAVNAAAAVSPRRFGRLRYCDHCWSCRAAILHGWCRYNGQFVWGLAEEHGKSICVI